MLTSFAILTGIHVTWRLRTGLQSRWMRRRRMRAKLPKDGKIIPHVKTNQWLWLRRQRSRAPSTCRRNGLPTPARVTIFVHPRISAKSAIQSNG